MGTFKCISCQAPLKITDGMTACTCDYCLTWQLVPKYHSKQIEEQIRLANDLRQNCQFDIAKEKYDELIKEHFDDPALYWFQLLCRYGIEYVQDDKNDRKMLPTCHRTSSKPIREDVYFKKALEYTTNTLDYTELEEQAKYIDEVMNKIRKLSENEKPYDVFICYKQTDRFERNTMEAAIGYEMYERLTEKKLNVFFSKVTLKDRLGIEYEPYIYAALQSAKVMVVIGASSENFNAKWVKNEWSRYIDLLNDDHSRLLIPVYQKMNASDIPKELARFQAKDLSEPAAINELVHTIADHVEREKPKFKDVQQTMLQGMVFNSSSKLTRAFLFLGDGEWEKAKSYFNEVLDHEPKNPQAYLGMFMAEKKIHTEADISREFKGMTAKADLFVNPNFKKAYDFADDELKNKLRGYNTESIYFYAESLEGSADFHRALFNYKRIPQYPGIEECISRCEEKAMKKDIANVMALFEKAKTSSDFREVRDYFINLKKYPLYADEAEKYEKLCEDKANEYDYKSAVYAMDKAADIKDYRKASEKFAELKEFKDSSEKKKECLYRSALLYIENAEKSSDKTGYGDACAVLKSVGDYRGSRELMDKYIQILYNTACESLKNAYSLEGYKLSKKYFDLIINVVPDYRDISTLAKKSADGIERCIKCKPELDAVKEKYQAPEKAPALKSIIQSFTNAKNLYSKNNPKRLSKVFNYLKVYVVINTVIIIISSISSFIDDDIRYYLPLFFTCIYCFLLGIRYIFKEEERPKDIFEIIAFLIGSYISIALYGIL